MGECVVDLDRALLLDRRGEPQRLRPRAWLVLRELARRAGHLVGKDELMAAVWSDAVVTDDSLVQAVADIRRALGASSRLALRTLPRRGYLLVGEAAPVDVVAPPVLEAVAVPVAARLGDRLRREAARRFVGRDAELDALRPAVGHAVPDPALFVVHGPGGIGKSSLLERVRLMADPEVAVVTLNGAELLPTPKGVIEGLAAALDLTGLSTSIERVSAAWALRGRSVLLLDTVEALDPVEAWMRDTWLPGLPAQVSVVLAGRRAPDSRWSTHPLWGGAMRVVPVGPLGNADCARLAEAHGVPAALCERISRRARGLPLAAVLLAIEARRTGRVPVDLGDELVRTLTRRCLDQSPSAAHREALLACALARRATRELLAHLFGSGPAQGLFDWLAGQGYVTVSRGELRLHDLIREAVLADAEGCDRDRFRSLRRTVVRFLAGRLGPGRDAWDATLDFFHARRHAPGFRRFHDVDGLSTLSTRIGIDDGVQEVLEFARQRLPAGEFRAFRRWVVHPAADIVTVRADDGAVCGVSVLLRTQALCDEDVAADPVVVRLRSALGARWREPSTAGYSLLARHWLADGDPSGPSPALTALMACANPLFADRALRLFVLWAPIPAYLDAMFVELGFRALPGCARDLGGRRFEMIVRDWQAEPWGDWVRRVVTPERTENAGPHET